MRVALVTRYGPPSVVEVGERPDPVPTRGQVLIRVKAASINSGDARIRGARFPSGFGVPARLAVGVRRPRQPILGTAFAGIVESVGETHTGWQIGDRVAGMNGVRMGAHAELISVSADRVIAIPDDVTDLDAAAVLFGGTTAMHFLRDLVTPGVTVLVNGGSGSVGTAAVQLAAAAGADVTAVTRGVNSLLMRQLGATVSIDHARTPVRDVTSRYDVVFDTVGNIPISDGTRLLRKGGVLLLAAAGLADTLRAHGRIRAGSAAERPADIVDLLARVAAGTFDPLADVLGGLEEVAAAHRLIDGGRKVGNLVVEPQR